MTNLYNEKFQIKLNKNTTIVQIKEDINIKQQEEEFTGTVVDIQSGSGLIKRCPECNRQVKNSMCSEHGKVEGIYHLRIKAVLDNESEIREPHLDAEQTYQVTGIDLAKAKEMAANALDQSVVVTAIEDALMGKYFTGRGDSTGRYLIVKNMKPSVMAVNAEIMAAAEAIRIFTQELSQTQLQSGKDESQKSDRLTPTHAFSPTGAKINRVFVCGALTEVDEMETQKASFVKARLVDATGGISIMAGQYQPEVANMLRNWQIKHPYSYPWSESPTYTDRVMAAAMSASDLKISMLLQHR